MQALRDREKVMIDTSPGAPVLGRGGRGITGVAIVSDIDNVRPGDTCGNIDGKVQECDDRSENRLGRSGAPHRWGLNARLHGVRSIHLRSKFSLRMPHP